MDPDSRNYGTPNFGAGPGNQMFDFITGIPPPAPYAIVAPPDFEPKNETEKKKL